ncbi:hypothetical protein [Candidatus Tisiphia endosymbiont of Hybos culiciformis]|uniref:hypothetical protein n=1 Tax=Candidatus Tisiphia endosymbiont of Hybos culiciformis TaxID=3139331 RepID=UPI003CCA99DC
MSFPCNYVILSNGGNLVDTCFRRYDTRIEESRFLYLHRYDNCFVANSKEII